MRSKPVSESSPDTGVTETRDEAPGSATSLPVSSSSTALPASEDTPAPHSGIEKPRGERTGAKATRIELEISRQRSIGWTIGGLIVGALLIKGLGTVGQWAGVVLVVMGLYHAWQLVQSLLHPPGTIVVSDREVVLPRGLCLPRPVVVTPSDITSIYFLRRSVPWNRAAPVLIVELGERAMAFPRDWFASEADQRHVIHAVLRSKGEAPPAASTADV
jgi:hypothetical protein